MVYEQLGQQHLQENEFGLTKRQQQYFKGNEALLDEGGLKAVQQLQGFFCSHSKMCLPSSHMLVMNAIKSFDQYCPVQWFVGSMVLKGNIRIRPLKESQVCIKEAITCLAMLPMDQ